MTEPIVVYSYYGNAIYRGGRLLGYSHSHLTPAYLCKLLGIPYEERTVRWEDWPGQKTNTRAVYDPPKTLAEVEEHFRRLEVERLEAAVRNGEANLERDREKLAALRAGSVKGE